MKTSNQDKEARQATARKITGTLCVISLGLVIASPRLAPETSLMNDILVFGGAGLCIALALIREKLTPNKETYRCTACDHTYIPKCNTMLRSKKRMHCPACNRQTVHRFVMPETTTPEKVEQ